MATSPNYGWEEPDDTDLVKDGALSIRTLGNAIDSTVGTALNNKLHAGLVLVKTQTIGTGVSSVTITNAFNSTYDNYRIVVSGGVGSTGNYFTLALGASATGYKWGASYSPYSTGTPTNFSASTGTTKFSDIGAFNTDFQDMSIELKSPNLAKFTLISSLFNFSTGFVYYGGQHSVATAYTDITIGTGSGTLTGGTIAVYGYAKD